MWLILCDGALKHDLHIFVFDDIAFKIEFNIENSRFYCRAKFTPFILRGKFGSFYVVYILDKSVSGTGCRSPPLQSEFP